MLISDEYIQSHSSASINLEIDELIEGKSKADSKKLFHYLIHFMKIVLTEKDPKAKAIDKSLFNLLALLT